MSWIQEQAALLKEFLAADFRRILRYCSIGMAAAILLGAAAAMMDPQLVTRTLGFFMDQIEANGVVDETGKLSVFALLMNNWRAMLFSAAYGFIPFLFLPVISILSNGALLGMLGAMYIAEGALPMFLAGILPHGIFELPALALSASCGVCLCLNMCRLVTGSPKRTPLVELVGDLLRVLLLIVLPLTVAAAFMECYVTPVIMGFFG